MSISPLRTLVLRRVCSCSSHPLNSTVPPRRFASVYANAASTYGSSEFLKRRYQPSPESVQQSAQDRAKILKRMKWSAVGILLCALGMWGTVHMYTRPKRLDKPKTGISLDAPPVITGVASETTAAEEVEQVATGTSTIPTFPRTIHLSSVDPPANAAVADIGDQEYQLVGLGIRTVSFLGIQVYVVGLYIAVADIATLQERLVRLVDPVATTLVAGEKSKLRDMLLDPERGEEVWHNILKQGGIRTAFRIVPTRNTDFMHLRDGWIRGITAKTQHFGAKDDQSFTDETFGQAVNDFKAIWGGGARKNVPKGETLLLTRDAEGKLTAWYEDKKGNSLRLGGLADERISRLIWLGYLGGKTVSSEGARQNIVDGVMEYIGRPIGTVATQVL